MSSLDNPIPSGTGTANQIAFWLTRTALTSSSTLTFNSSTGILTATGFVGNLTGSASLNLLLTGGTLSGLLTTVGITNGTTAINNSAGYTQSGTSANTLTGATVLNVSNANALNIQDGSGNSIHNFSTTSTGSAYVITRLGVSTQSITFFVSGGSAGFNIPAGIGEYEYLVHNGAIGMGFVRANGQFFTADTDPTIASATSLTLDRFTLKAHTINFTGNTAITTATGVNLANFSAPTYGGGSGVAITVASTVYISGAPIAGGATTITNAYALWVDSGNVRFDGLLAQYNNVATTGWGIPAIYGTGRSTGQTAAVTSVATYTVGAADGSFLVSCNVNVTTSTLHSFSVQVTYTDETNTAQTLTLSVMQLAGTIIQTITNATGAGPYEGIPVHIRAKAATAITVKTAGTFTTVTYNVEGTITQIS